MLDNDEKVQRIALRGDVLPATLSICFDDIPRILEGGVMRLQENYLSTLNGCAEFVDYTTANFS
jgi:hypothetical protein